MHTVPALALVVLALLAAPAHALVLSDSVELVVHGPLTAPPGQDLVLRAPRIVLDHAWLSAGNGADGPSMVAAHEATGGDGANGGSIRLDGAVVCLASELQPGRGGRGGDAEAWGTPHGKDAIARGGAGGNAGAVIGDAPGCLIWPARAGDGGTAQASGDQAPCAGGKGADAGVDHANDTTTVGSGLDADARASEGGPGAQCRGATFSDGGQGGNASAYGGPGGIRSSDGEGANGGNATALAGQGGVGGGLCARDATQFESAWTSGLRQAGAGGPGGVAVAVGGKGGSGLTTGGDGGRAVAFSQGGPGGAGSSHGGDAIAAGAGGDVLPGSKATGGAGGTGIGGGSGGKASAITLKGPDGPACLVGAPTSASGSSSVGAPPMTTTSQSDSQATGTKGSPGPLLPMALVALAFALVARRRR